MSIFSPHFRSFFKPSTRPDGRGFTLIELLVVVAVITIMTAVLLLQQKKFDSSTILRSLAYSVALSIRQAQVYGTSIRQFDTTSNGFNYNYSVAFRKTITDSYTLFADIDGNKQYSTTPTDEKVQQFKIASGYTISKFCGITSGGQECSPTLTYLTIYFKRPNPDAFFASDGSGGGGNYCAAYIVLTGPGGDTRSVKVTTTGQIQIGAINAAVTGC